MGRFAGLPARVVMKPAEQTPASIWVWLELVADLLPNGVLNIVDGFGIEAGKPLAFSRRRCATPKQSF